MEIKKMPIQEGNNKTLPSEKISQNREAQADTLIDEIIRYSKASEHPIKYPGKNPIVHLATPNIPPENGSAENNSQLQRTKAKYALAVKNKLTKQDPNPLWSPATHPK